MSETTESEDRYPASMLREYATDDLDADHSDVYRHAGLIQDDEMRAVVTYLASIYDPNYHEELPATFWETETARRIIRKFGTEQAQRAVESGHEDLLNYIVGLPQLETDLSGLHTLEWLRDWVTRVAAITIISGHMGAGKTDFALLLGEVWSHVMEEAGEKHSVFTNITTCEDADETVSRMSKLKELAERDDDESFLMIWDEASSHASGYAGDAQEVQDQLRRFTRMIRKNGGYLIIIGHAKGGADIHPDVRRLAQSVYKFSKKDAAIYYGIEDRGYTDKLNDIGGIPQTNWTYDTEEDSDWEWDLEDEEAEEYDDAEEEEPEWEMCRGIRTNGEPCRQPAHALNEHGFCDSHEDQYQQYRDLLDDPEHERCRGTCEDGSECMMPTHAPLDEHGYCPDHQDQYDPDDKEEIADDEDEEEERQCKGTTDDGERCSRTGHHVQPNGYCDKHQDQAGDGE